MQLIHRYQRNFEEYVRRNLGLILLLAAVFVIGVIFGGLAIRSAGARDRAEIAAYLSETFERIVHPEAADSRLIFKLSLARSAIQLGFLWAVGITLLAIPCTVAGALVFGFVSGYTISFLTAEMGWGGLALGVAGHLPHSLLAIPALIMGATAAGSFSLQIVRSWRERRRLTNFYPALARFTGSLLAAGLVLVLAGVVEAYVSPALARAAINLLHLS